MTSIVQSTYTPNIFQSILGFLANQVSSIDSVEIRHDDTHPPQLVELRRFIQQDLGMEEISAG